MLLTKFYDEAKKTEEAWFDSTMIIYTKMVEDPNENKGELYITYKGGATYVYHDVTFQDYVVFIGGGTDGSHGKTINKIIKGAYEFEKLEPLDLSWVNDRMNEVIEIKRQEAEAYSTNYKKRWDDLKTAVSNILKQMEIDEKDSNGEITEIMYNEYVELLNVLTTNVNDN
jgi:hypothetical protein